MSTYLDLLEHEGTRDAALVLLVHVALSDNELRDDEFTLIQQLLPRLEPEQLRGRIRELASTPFDVEQVLPALATEQQRWHALRFAACMAWTDRELQLEEKRLLIELAAGFELPSDAVEQILAEIVGRVDGPLVTDRVEAAVRQTHWEDLEFVAAAPRSGLAATIPADARVIGCLRLDGIEQVVLCDQGMAAGFREGDGWIAWSAVQSYTRVPVFGAAVRVQTGEARWTLADVRLRSMGLFLDQLFAA